MFCTLCCKHFNKPNSFDNHLNSKKHKDLEAAAQLKASENEPADKKVESNSVEKDSFAVKSDRSVKKAMQMEQDMQKKEELLEEIETADEAGDDKEWEDVNDEDMDKFGN